MVGEDLMQFFPDINFKFEFDTGENDELEAGNQETHIKEPEEEDIGEEVDYSPENPVDSNNVPSLNLIIILIEAPKINEEELNSDEDYEIDDNELLKQHYKLKMMQRSFYLQLQKEIANPSAMIHLSFLLLKKKKTTTTTKKQAQGEMVMMMMMTTTTTTKMIHFERRRVGILLMNLKLMGLMK